MGNTSNRIETLFERIEEFGKTSFELYKLRTISKTAKIISSFITNATVIILISISLFFASIGLAIWLGEILGKSYLGFLCVSSFYFLLGLIVFFFMSKFIRRKVSNSIISQTLNK